jgi:hypothetical protein
MELEDRGSIVGRGKDFYFYHHIKTGSDTDIVAMLPTSAPQNHFYKIPPNFTTSSTRGFQPFKPCGHHSLSSRETTS